MHSYMGDRLVVARTAERGGQSLLTGFIFEKTLRKHSLSLWGLHWSTFLQAMEGGSFRNIRSIFSLSRFSYGWVGRFPLLKWCRGIDAKLWKVLGHFQQSLLEFVVFQQRQLVTFRLSLQLQH